MVAGTAPRRMPWRRVIGVLIVLAIPMIAAGSLDGFASGSLVLTAAAGVICGLAGAVFGQIRQALLAILVAWTAASLVETPTPGIDPRAVALGLALLCGVEAWRSGGRAMTIAIAATVLLHTASRTAPPWDLTSAAVYAASAGLGFVAIWAAGGVGSRAPQPAPATEALALVLFLAIGLCLTITLTQTMHRPEAIWLILMFVFRALVPPRAAYIAHLRFAIGAVLGAFLAGLLAQGVLGPFGLAQNHLVIGTICALAVATGLRFMPAQNIVPPLAYSVAAVTVVGPSASTALIRGEDALGIAALAMVLSFGLDWALGSRTNSPRAQ